LRNWRRSAGKKHRWEEKGRIVGNSGGSFLTVSKKQGEEPTLKDKVTRSNTIKRKRFDLKDASGPTRAADGGEELGKNGGFRLVGCADFRTQRKPRPATTREQNNPLAEKPCTGQKNWEKTRGGIPNQWKRKNFVAGLG